MTEGNEGTMFCPNCGNQIDDTVSFCTHCGAPIENGTLEPEASSTPHQTSDAAESPSTQSAKPPVGTKTDSSSKRRAPMIAVIIASVLVVLVLGSYLLWQTFMAPSSATTTHAIVLPVEAEGYSDATSTPIPLQVTGTTSAGEEINETAYLSADGTGLKLEPGTYSVQVAASPLSEDGTFYEMPDASYEITVGNDLAAGESLSLPDGQAVKLDVADPTTVTDQQRADAEQYAEASGTNIDIDAATQATDNLQACYQAYDEVLQQYETAVNSNFATTGSLVGTHANIPADNLKYYEYAMVDINEDSIPELFIRGKSEENDEGIILDLITFRNGSIARIWDGALSERSAFTLCEDDTLYYRGSGGASRGTSAIYRLPSEGTSLEVVEKVEWDAPGADKPVYTYTDSAGTSRSSSSDEANALQSKHPARTDITWKSVNNYTSPTANQSTAGTADSAAAQQTAQDFLTAWFSQWKFVDGKMVTISSDTRADSLKHLNPNTSFYQDFSSGGVGSFSYKSVATCCLETTAQSIGSGVFHCGVRYWGTQNTFTEDEIRSTLGDGNWMYFDITVGSDGLISNVVKSS